MKVRCRYCKKLHKVSEYQVGAFGRCAYCPEFGITVSVGRRKNGTLYMLDHQLGTVRNHRRCRTCNGTGDELLPKRLQAKQKSDAERMKEVDFR